MSTQLVDQKARDMAQAALSKIQSHEAGCEIRWTGTMSTLKEIKAILAWGLCTLSVTGIGLVGYLWTHPPPH